MKIWTFHQVFISWRLLSSFDNELSIIRLEHCAKFSLFWSIRAVFCTKRKTWTWKWKDSESQRICALQTSGCRLQTAQPYWTAVHCSVLMHYFLLVIFHTGTHLVTPIPLSCFPEGQFDLLSEWHALFWRGFCGISKNLTANGHIFFFFFLIENLWNICP